jgi:hypothetical protein
MRGDDVTTAIIGALFIVFLVGALVASAIWWVF